jgi:hypothetical protein
VLIFKNGEDVSDACDTANGKGNPFGWSSYDLMHHSRRIGSVYCGTPELDKEAVALGYTMTVTEEEKP